MKPFVYFWNSIFTKSSFNQNKQVCYVVSLLKLAGMYFFLNTNEHQNLSFNDAAIARVQYSGL